MNLFILDERLARRGRKWTGSGSCGAGGPGAIYGVPVLAVRPARR